MGANGTVGRLARELVERIRVLTLDIDDLTYEITTMVAEMAPTLLAIPGCGALTAAKILGETAGVERFKSKDTDHRSDVGLWVGACRRGTPARSRSILSSSVLQRSRSRVTLR